MASIGQVVVNTATGERVVFLALNRDTAGELLKADGYLAPGAAARGMHIHPQQEERFEVLDGSLRFRIGREERIAKAGDVIVVPPGTPHLPSNIGEVEAHCLMEFRPALNTETFFENAFSMLSARGPRASFGMILEFSELLAHYRPEFRLAPPPLHLLTIMAAPLGRLAGYRPRVPVQA
jgi:mannose-6-phosphate isomerase-like protein (cupin superfamily)